MVLMLNKYIEYAFKPPHDKREQKDFYAHAIVGAVGLGFLVYAMVDSYLRFW